MDGNLSVIQRECTRYCCCTCFCICECSERNSLFQHSKMAANFLLVSLFHSFALFMSLKFICCVFLRRRNVSHTFHKFLIWHTNDNCLSTFMHFLSSRRVWCTVKRWNKRGINLFLCRFCVALFLPLYFWHLSLLSLLSLHSSLNENINMQIDDKKYLSWSKWASIFLALTLLW